MRRWFSFYYARLETTGRLDIIKYNSMPLDTNRFGDFKCAGEGVCEGGRLCQAVLKRLRKPMP
jgi:hypothetical protein